MSVLTKEVRYHKSMSSQLMFYFAVLRSRNNPKLLQIHNVTTRYRNSDFTWTNMHYGDFFNWYLLSTLLCLLWWFLLKKSWSKIFSHHNLRCPHYRRIMKYLGSHNYGHAGRHTYTHTHTHTYMIYIYIYIPYIHIYIYKYKQRDVAIAIAKTLNVYAKTKQKWIII